MYELKTDDGDVVWKGDRKPTARIVDKVALDINSRGWNGVGLEIYKDGRYVRTVEPSEEAKAKYE